MIRIKDKDLYINAVRCGCGHLNSKDNKYCEMCGANLSLIQNTLSNFDFINEDPVICYCGHENSKNSAYCEMCGFPLKKINNYKSTESILCVCSCLNDISNKYCSNCGLELNKEQKLLSCICGEKNPLDSKFCNVCDRPLNPERIISSKFVCSCGAILEFNVDFCPYCGKKLKSKPSTQLKLKNNEINRTNKCPHCGTLNFDDSIICSKCKTKLKPILINDFDLLFTSENKNLLENASLSKDEYYNILNKIFYKNENFLFYGNSTKEKILNFVSYFSKCETKSKGLEYGFTLGNIIYYDDRLDDSIQIATIIHELTHSLLFKIFSGIFCYILKIKESKTVDAFIWYFLSSFEDIKIMNEYCAHSVEGRFVPYGYQNYGSFNNLLESTSLSTESIADAIILGNSFASDIIVFLERFIDEELRNEIKIQYKRDLKNPDYEPIKLETSEILDFQDKNNKILAMLNFVFEEASSKNNQDELNFIKSGMEDL